MLTKDKKIAIWERKIIMRISLPKMESENLGTTRGYISYLIKSSRIRRLIHV
jgi:hypothetical protein